MIEAYANFECLFLKFDCLILGISQLKSRLIKHADVGKQI